MSVPNRPTRAENAVDVSTFQEAVRVRRMILR